MADSDSSSLSSAPSSDDEEMAQKMALKPTGLDRYFKAAPKPEATPEPPKRAPSPPHEYTLADNPAIALIVMFRSRFSDVFPKSLPNYGPQDIERGVSGELPDEQVERLLCALLGLVMNRKKDVERGHYGRALDDAISANHSQWPMEWKGVNPLHGGKNFNNMSPEERLSLLKALILWSLNSSEAVQALIKESYKQTRRDDDRNQPRSVQPWFSDQYRRKYWLVEGQDDSHFRIYRENDGKTAKTNTWFSVAGSIQDVIALADKFADEHSSNSKVISDKLRAAIPRFEAGEEKRKRRDYRLARKAAFARPEPGFSLYEGRTRGKRMRYTYSDDEYGSDGLSSKRSTRHSGISTPLETGPTVTASGRQVKSRVGGLYGESMLIDQRKELERATGEGNFTETSDDMPATMAASRDIRTSRSGRQVKPTRHGYADQMDSDESEEAQSSGREWSGNEDEPDESEPDFDREEEDDDEDEDMSEDGLEPDEVEEDENTQESLVVQLRYRKDAQTPTSTATAQAPPPDSPHITNRTSTVVNGLQQAQAQATPRSLRPLGEMMDTIDFAPGNKQADKGQQHLLNGVKTTDLDSPRPPPAVHVPIQPMDIS
ncbi:uncharacterized protein A1O5_00076 [Cladophialophora psammophila CBS 110553]|uniref:WHIM1 domain-containing protein n=1 Tax=Cladophialophora psammophila CBS 110553 TaxID=1182543 RepID=W9XE11_9EURO|nr:uncharacterized protein A1O5_00076 [Cladophialophora psammophila CBS 110553]EXJ75570.1 hypothetical protein A1O5_00076 [Cladophialophora psammophila CBS 110553]